MNPSARDGRYRIPVEVAIRAILVVVELHPNIIVSALW